MSTSPQLEPRERRRAMRRSICLQCAGTLGQLVLLNNFMLLYLTALGMGDVGIMVTLQIWNIGLATLTVPFASLADRRGLKRVGSVGLALGILGYVLATAGGSLSGATARWTVVGGLILFAVGGAGFLSGWWSLLVPIVPDTQRGRYFARLRVSWQAIGIVAALLVWMVFEQNSPRWHFQAFLAVVTVGQVLRLYWYSRLPELPQAGADGDNFLQSLRTVIRTPLYAPFCAYVFLLTLFTCAAPMLFGLVAKSVLGLGDDVVLGLGLLMMFGNVFGHWLGGVAVDRFGSKGVFMICHFAFGTVLLLFPARVLLPWPALLTMAVCQVLWGLFFAAGGIAITTETMALAPARNRALAISITNSLRIAGAALSGLLPALMVQLGILRERWQFAGGEFSQYDSILLLAAVMVVLLVVTLGLVPAVMRPEGVYYPVN